MVIRPTNIFGKSQSRKGLQMIQEWNTQQLLDLLAPIEEAVKIKSKRGMRMMGGFWKSVLKISFRILYPQLRNHRRAKTSQAVFADYSADYGQSSPEQFLERYKILLKKDYFRINKEVIVRCSKSRVIYAMRKRVGDVIGALQPRRVCEVGSGTGEVVMYLANRFPELDFTGYELTETGTQLARSLQKHPLLETTFGNLYEFNAKGMEAVRRINFQTASAFDLPCKDRSFDVVYTQAASSKWQTACRRHWLKFGALLINTSSFVNPSLM